jgi:hypothetical protein
MTDVSCCRKCLTVFAKKGCEQEDTSARAQRNAVIIARIAWSGSASGLVAGIRRAHERQLKSKCQVRPVKSFRESTLLYERQTSLVEGVDLGCGDGTHEKPRETGKKRSQIGRTRGLTPSCKTHFPRSSKEGQSLGIGMACLV